MANDLSLETPLGELEGVGPYTLKRLENIGLQTLRDLLEWLPFRYEDYRHISDISQLPFDEERVIRGVIKRVGVRRSQSGTLIVEAQVTDSTGSIKAIWFNQRYLLKQLRSGEEMMLYGQRRLIPALNRPFFVKRIVSAAKLTPIYRTTAGVGQATIRSLIRRLGPFIDTVPDVIPASWRAKLALPNKSTALRLCHFPEEVSDLAIAQKLLAMEELITLCLRAKLARRLAGRHSAPVINGSDKTIESIVKHLPFKLTNGQKSAIKAISQLLARGEPSRCLLYGEVGSGKTAVAAVISALTAKKGKVVWLNPTVSLAKQQVESLRGYLSETDIKIAELTSANRKGFAQADLVIGTHAIINNINQLAKVALIVVDEQHRFGAKQRQQLLQEHPNAHLLMMSATPIPRSLAQTIFGHLDIVNLPDKPAHQKPIKTVLFNEDKRSVIEEEIDQRLNRGEQGYVICPLIFSPEQILRPLFLERKAVEQERTRLKERFPNVKIGVVHGQMPIEERQKVLEQFRHGQLAILLSTTIVEVGIDNPNATWILIEEADRFGLSQLHQLRGRVGRGSRPSVCYLAQTLVDPKSQERLKALQQTNDGLALAELDLKLRGPGELTGQQQSGLPKLRYASLNDLEMIKSAEAIAAWVDEQGLNDHPEIKRLVAKSALSDEVVVA